VSLIKKYNSIKKILQELDCEMMYLDGTLEHIECWTTEYQVKKIIINLVCL
jgi:hypothetical protein